MTGFLREVALLVRELTLWVVDARVHARATHARTASDLHTVAFGVVLDCDHRWLDVSVDASSWCRDYTHGGWPPIHPGVRCRICGEVRDLLLSPDPRDPSEALS